MEGENDTYPPHVLMPEKPGCDSVSPVHFNIGDKGLPPASSDAVAVPDIAKDRWPHLRLAPTLGDAQAHENHRKDVLRQVERAVNDKCPRSVHEDVQADWMEQQRCPGVHTGLIVHVPGQLQ